MTTYAELITPKSADTLRTELLARLAAAGFPVTAWQTGGAARTLVQVDVVTLAELYDLVALIGRAWSLDDAENDWLTLHALSRFNLTRIPASFAKHVVRLTVASGAGPYSINPGQLVVSTAGGVRLRSTNTGVVTISSAQTVDFTVQAETAGIAGNNTPVALITPALAGVTMAWQSRSETARDVETDPALRTRCRDRWATLGSGFSREAVRYWATSAEVSPGVSAGVTRVVVPSSPGDGTYRAILAGATGALGAPQVAAVQAALELHGPVTDSPTAESAVEQTVTVAGTVRFKSVSSGAEQIAVWNAIATYINGLDLPDDGDTVTVDREGIAAAIYGAAPGRIADVDLSTPAADVTVTLGFVAIAETSGVAFTV